MPTSMAVLWLLHLCSEHCRSTTSITNMGTASVFRPCWTMTGCVRVLDSGPNVSYVWVCQFHSSRVMLDAQDKQQLCNWQTYFRTVLQYQPHETVGHWETGPEYVCQNQCNRCTRRILSKTEQSYSEKYNKRKVVIKITGLNPLQDVSNVFVPMVCCVQLLPDCISRL